MSKSIEDKVQFRIELVLALTITGLACAAGFSNLLFASNDLFPLTSDAMGHMAKVRFLADSFAQGEFPSWFPYWYNGSTVAQYYPPFSYWIMTPIFMLVNNAMLTFKIYCFIMIFIGGVGVWYFCRRFIGSWCGILGTVLFCIQPYILLTFYGAGLLAQGPIVALTPWYLITLITFSKTQKAKSFIWNTILCALMILSHPMTIFMICLCIMIALFVYVFLRKITVPCYLYMILSIVFAGIITAFWSLVGTTGLETPGIPYLLTEAALKYTADIQWFTTISSGFFYFGIPVSIGSLFACLLYRYRAVKKQAGQEQYPLLLCIILTIVSVVFSFGLNLPLFKFLPLAESFVPGRILVLTAVSGAILCAYLIYGVQVSVVEKKVSIQFITSIFCLVLIGSAIFVMNPLKSAYLTKNDYNFNEMIEKNHIDGSNFDKGRYADIGLIDSNETYFPLSYEFNIIFGWNIEGTPHNQFFWDQSTAEATDNDDFIAKELAYWNVRSLYIVEDFNEVLRELIKQYPFELKFTRDNRSLYVCDAPNSYFLKDNRNALLLGAGSSGIAMEYPYLVHERREDITDYSQDELEKYKMIYLCEPEVNTIQDKNRIEQIIEKLVDQGVTVLIEPENDTNYSLYDVTVSDVTLDESPSIKKQGHSPIESRADAIQVDENMNYGRVLFGLDEVYYRLEQNDGRLINDIIGTKKVGDGEVVFIGMHLSQYLKAVYARNWGVPESESGYPDCTDEVKALFEDIFNTYGVNKDFWPDPFPVRKADWNYKGVDFTYSSQKAQEMTLSVTYTPRWRATIDGDPVQVGQKENLITLNLPAGDHQVKLVYGLTIYGIVGYIISLAGLLLFILFLKFYEIILLRFRQICIKINRFLQLGYKEE
ncbi:MAG TPA: 6-pyruvoyl-tetrahydropterin synthase-related protein [Anaerovoracaceae bacterium]|nr:6-pyruvoyl-tetrahydropterin synthase-related protein [Anaerovoracaceae bacterium]